MRKLKQVFSMTLALALSLALTVPAMAAGEPGSTTIQDDKGFSYTLSKPVVGTRVDEQYGITYYQITEGTIITPVLPEGTVKEEEVETGEYYMAGSLVYKLPNGGGVVAYAVGTVVGSDYGVYDALWFGDLEGMSTFDDEAKATPTQPLPATPPFGGDRGYCLSRGFREDYNTFDRYTYLFFEIVPENGGTVPMEPEQPTQPVTPDAPGTYTVKKGDTWSSICTNFYGTNSQRYELMKANKGVTLKEGAVITLPEKLGKDTLIPAAVAGEGEKLYTVKLGDTLGKIAAAEYGKASEYKAIFERNADRLKNANTIYEGQVIVLPAKQ